MNKLQTALNLALVLILALSVCVLGGEIDEWFNITSVQACELERCFFNPVAVLDTSNIVDLRQVRA